MRITPTPTRTITPIIVPMLCPDTMVATIGAMDIAIPIDMKAGATGMAVTGGFMETAGPDHAGGNNRSVLESLPDKAYVLLQVSRQRKARNAPARTSIK